MTIAIVERYSHWMDLEYALHVLRHRHAVLVYAEPNNLNKVPEDNRGGTVHEVYDAKVDLFVVITVMVDPRPWTKLACLNKPMICFVHNANWHFGSTIARSGLGLSMWARQLRWHFAGYTQARRKVMQLFSGYVFPSARIAEEHRSGSQRPSIGLPWALPTPLNRGGRPEDPKRYVITGGIDSQYRDYQTVLHGIKQLGDDVPRELEFLGRPNTAAGSKVIADFKRMANDDRTSADSSSLSIVSYDRYIPDDLYLERLTSCFAIINPYRAVVPFAGYREYGGRTKISGSETDQIRANKPALVAAGYRGMDCLSGVQFAYSTAEQFAERIHELEGMATPDLAVVCPDILVHINLWSQLIEEVTRNKWA